MTNKPFRSRGSFQLPQTTEGRKAVREGDRESRMGVGTAEFSACRTATLQLSQEREQNASCSCKQRNA